MNWTRARTLRLFSPDLVKSAGGSLTIDGSRPRLCIPSARGSGGSAAPPSATLVRHQPRAHPERPAHAWDPTPPSAAPSGVPRTRNSEASASKGPRRKERLGFFIIIIILPPSLPPRRRFIFFPLGGRRIPQLGVVIRVGPLPGCTPDSPAMTEQLC